MLISAWITLVPGASDIETLRKSRFTHLHSTLLPQVTGQRNRRRLASPLHGTLTPGRISVGRPALQDGSIIVAGRVIARQPATDCFWTDGNRWAPYFLAALMEAFREACPPSPYPRFHRWSWRILRRRLPLSSRGPASNVSKSLDI